MLMVTKASPKYERVPILLGLEADRVRLGQEVAVPVPAHLGGGVALVFGSCLDLTGSPPDKSKWVGEPYDA